MKTGFDVTLLLQKFLNEKKNTQPDTRDTVRHVTVLVSPLYINT